MWLKIVGHIDKKRRTEKILPGGYRIKNPLRCARAGDISAAAELGWQCVDVPENPGGLGGSKEFEIFPLSSKHRLPIKIFSSSSGWEKIQAKHNPMLHLYLYFPDGGIMEKSFYFPQTPHFNPLLSGHLIDQQTYF